MPTAVAMTAPRHYAIKGGANPHTRHEDDSLKRVDASVARDQWHDYVDALLDGGVDVYVFEPVEDLTGMVFTANAGFLKGRLDDERSTTEKTFYPSHFTAEHRVPEADAYVEFFESFGFEVDDYPADWRFEGEADAFPIGRSGDLEWLFTYGFRSEPNVGDWLEEEIVGETFHRFRLTDPKYYHGDCLICDLGGPLLAWKGGLEDESAERLESVFGDRIVDLDDTDAEQFIGNSFYVETEGERLLYAPAAIRDATRARIEERGVDVVPVDISEFFGKGGGGPKCMVFNLGEIDPDEEALTDEQRQFRHRRHVTSLRERGYFERD
jgi:N-dimethylarginine dimethylaminohydrolase